MSRGHLYVLMLVLSFAGMIWMTIHLAIPDTGAGGSSVCLFRTVTGVDCPSCGTTRSILALVAGDLPSALRFNPLGFFMLPLLVLVPVWVLSDLIRQSDSFLMSWQRVESALKRPIFFLPLAGLVIGNWIRLLTMNG